MKAMSFMLTTDQVLKRTKDVTRRNGWLKLKSGDRVKAVRKAMGLKKGERQEVLSIIEIVTVTREPLNAITQEDVIREGFPEMTPAAFVDMFCDSHRGVVPSTVITRIEFRYVQ